MARATVTKIAGLYTSPNSISSVPEGALKRATNCVINFPDTIESRRGFDYLPYSFGSSIADRAKALFSYQGQVLVHYGDKLAYDSGASLVDYAGSYTGPNEALLRMKGAEAARDFYFTTTDGPRVLDTYNGTPVKAGVPRGPALRLSLSGNPNAGWFEPDGQVAYIAVIGKRDAEDNVVLGEASSGDFYANPADIHLVAGTSAASPYVATSHFLNGPSRRTEAEIRNVGPFHAYGYAAGDLVVATFDPADAAVFATGTYTVTIPLPPPAYTTPSGADKFWLKLNVTPFPGDDINLTGPAVITSGTKSVSVTFDISPELDTTHFIQIYRTKQSLTASSIPAPDYYLVNEVPLTSAIITAGSYTFVDTTPDALLLTPYYANANVGYEIADGSPDNENGRLPLCNDLEVWDERLWGANLVERENLTIHLLGTGAPTGLQVGDAITIAGQTYTAVSETTVTPTATQFRLYDAVTSTKGGAGYYLPSDAVKKTAEALANAVTKNAASAVNAYYTSTADETPGEIFLEARDAGGAQFFVYVNRPGAWNPVMGNTPTPGNQYPSSSDIATNGLWFSKQDEPEAVPRLNRITVGPKNWNILRIKALQQKLYVFCDRGIYTVSGSYPYRVDLLSKTSILVAPDSVADLDDALFALTTQGVVRINDGGIGIISVPVEADIKRLFGGSLSILRASAQAVGYESYRKYILNMPTTSDDTDNTQSLVYDVATHTWTRWDKPIACSVVVPETDFLFVAPTTTNKISKERKTYTRWDYIDESFSLDVLASSGKQVTLADASSLAAGDLIYQSALCHGIVDSVSGNIATMLTTESWTVGLATTGYSAITCELLFVEQHAGKPSEGKHFREVNYHFKTPGFSRGTAIFTSELNPSDGTVDVDLSGWGSNGGWGNFAWAQPAGPKNKRVLVPINATRSAYLGVGFRVTEGICVWALYGYSAEFEPMSERSAK